MAELLDVKELKSEVFEDKISEWSLYEMVKRRGLPHIKIGKRIYFRRQSVIDWLNQQETASTAELTTSTCRIRSLK